MAEVTRRILETVGLEVDRFRIDWASAAEAPRFVQIVTDFTNRIKEIGPLGEFEGLDAETLKLRLEAARQLASKSRFRAAYGNLAREFKKAGDYSPESIAQKVEEKIVPLIRKDLLESEVKALLAKGPISLDTLLQKTGATQDDIVPILEALSKRGQVERQGDLWQPKAKE
jgi:hypothetical protein